MPDELPAISLDLFSDLGSGDIFQTVELASASEDLLDEPEFAEITFDPLTTVATFINTAEEMGLDPVSLYSDDDMQDITNRVIPELVTADLRTELIAATTSLRERLRAANQSSKLQTATAVQFILEQEALNPILLTIGLLRKLLTDGLRPALHCLTFRPKSKLWAQTNESVPFNELQERLL
ncbi:MAG: hypothetical protein R2932_14665 [Caldilineaceae bacterium]